MVLRIMMAQGGPESWFMIPLVDFGSTKDVTLVRRVERRMITKVPNNLNNRTDLNRFGTWVEAINLQGEHTTLQETDPFGNHW